MIQYYVFWVGQKLDKEKKEHLNLRDLTFKMFKSDVFVN